MWYSDMACVRFCGYSVVKLWILDVNIGIPTAEFFNKIRCKDRHSQKMVNGDIEKSLYLRAVEVH